MMRTIATVAMAEYDRWYIVAHSQGTVVAFNGLMETPYAWPGNFDSETWYALRNRGFGGPGNVVPSGGPTMPRRPVWAPPDEIAYRTRIFSRFRGLLTLGSPLEKFATIWPARVPISRLRAFRQNTAWINVFDPLDPISGVLKAFDNHPDEVCPAPVNVGYTSYWLLLLAHLRYVTWTRRGCMGDGVAQWLLTDNQQTITSGHGRFNPGSGQSWRRTAAAWAWWFLAFALLAVVGGCTVHATKSWLATLVPSQCPAETAVCGWVVAAWQLLSGIGDWLVAAWHWIDPWPTGRDALAVVAFGIAGTLSVGAISNWFLFRAGEDPEAPSIAGAALPDPDPKAPSLPPW
jgi:hypothetical protein